MSTTAAYEHFTLRGAQKRKPAKAVTSGGSSAEWRALPLEGECDAVRRAASSSVVRGSASAADMGDTIDDAHTFLLALHFNGRTLRHEDKSRGEGAIDWSHDLFLLPISLLTCTSLVLRTSSAAAAASASRLCLCCTRKRSDSGRC